MKKIISLITALSVLTSFPVFSVYAENEDNPDLKAMASSLGADTDCLNVSNYYQDSTSIPRLSYNHWLKNATNVEFTRYPETFFYSTAQSGGCLGISIINVLCHNGVISPSDIQEGAENLYDITYDSYDGNVNKVITDYQTLQAHVEYKLLSNYLLSSVSHGEQVKSIVETAEKSMSENKYFLLFFQTDKIYHALTGIGITDGSWSFNDISYDKCILTLDSNATDENDNVKFSEKGCVYINSETKQVYIPAYEASSDNKLSVAAIDDDTLLNYKGSVNPSSEIKTDVSKINRLELQSTGSTLYDLSVTDENGNAVETGEAVEGVSDRTYYTTGSRITVKNVYNDPAAKTDDINSFCIENTDGIFWIDTHGGKSEITAENGHYHFESVDGKEINYSIKMSMNEGSYGFTPHFSWTVGGTTSDKADIYITDKGIILDNENGTSDLASFSDVYFDESGNITDTDKLDNLFYIDTVGSVMLAFDEDNQLKYYLDDNDDGIYDQKVQNGDVNCDGFVDSVDASIVLQTYASLSTTIMPNPSTRINADYNGDGLIDSVDATMILSRYAEISAS